MPKFDYTREFGRCVVAGEPLIFHCHHYNAFLQRSLLDADFFDTRPILIGAGAELGYALTRQLSGTSPEFKLELAAQTYAAQGFGKLDVSKLQAEGGAVLSSSSHYASGWSSKFGAPAEAIDLFTRGWLAGAFAAAFGLPLAEVDCGVESCLSQGAAEAHYTLSRGPNPWPIYQSPALGICRNVEALGALAPFDRGAIRDAVLGMDLRGDNDGLIRAFGVMLTRHFANYYNRVSFEFERALARQFGPEGIDAGRPLLIEAGRVCAFFTLGGIMLSSEWEALIEPQLHSREDWAHGILSVIDSFGWGRWDVQDLSEAGATFIASNDYESSGYLALYGQAEHPVTYLFEGGVLGLMTLLYPCDIASRPSLDQAFYDKHFKGQTQYQATVLSCRAMGADATVIRVDKA